MIRFERAVVAGIQELKVVGTRDTIVISAKWDGKVLGEIEMYDTDTAEQLVLLLKQAIKAKESGR